MTLGCGPSLTITRVKQQKRFIRKLASLSLSKNNVYWKTTVQLRTVSRTNFAKCFGRTDHVGSTLSSADDCKSFIRRCQSSTTKLSKNYQSPQVLHSNRLDRLTQMMRGWNRSVDKKRPPLLGSGFIEHSMPATNHLFQSCLARVSHSCRAK